MAKKLELKSLTSANTELIVSIADPKDGLALSAGGGRENHAGAGKRQGRQGGFFR